MASYSFTVGAHTAGQSYQIVNNGGSVVASGSVPTNPTAPGEITFSVDLDEGTYFVKGPGISQSEGARYAGIANTPGAAETAIFVGTATGATDGSLVPITLTVSGEVKEWAPLEGGQVVLDPATAGGCYAQVRALTLLDFSGTTPPDDPDTIGVFQALDKDGDPLITGDTVTVTGDGEDEQTVTNPPEGGFVAGGTLAVGAGAAAGDVTDGVATFAVSVTVTRFVPAPPEPELP